MTISLTPLPYVIEDQYDDGLNTRHYTFAPIETNSVINTVIPGQFFMLTIPGEGEMAITFSSLPDVNGFFSAIVRSTGRVTRSLFALSKGAVVGIRGPLGKGWPLKYLANKNICLIAGGCGLATLSPLMDSLIQQGNSPVLVYGAKDKRSLVLNVEWARWQQSSVLVQVLMDGQYASEGESKSCLEGNPVEHIDRIVAEQKRVPDVVLTCGPEIMMAAVAEKMVSIGLSPNNIYLSLERRMHCGVGTCGHCYFGDRYVCTDGPTFSWSEFTALVN